MKVLSWNVDGTFPPQGSPADIEDQVGWLDSLETLPDVLMLQEVNPNRQELWHKLLLNRLGYHELADTLDLALKLGNSNGHITAIIGDWSLSQNPFDGDEDEAGSVDGDAFPMEYPEKILVTTVEYSHTEIELWNIRAVPGGEYPEEKLKILEQVYDRIENEGRKPRILAGDLNTPKQELADGQAITYGYQRAAELQRRGVNAELNILKGLGHFGMVDVFRAQYGYGDIEPLDVSHNGRRIDHLFASKELSPSDCWYSAAGLEHSDHAPVIAEFDV